MGLIKYILLNNQFLTLPFLLFNRNQLVGWGQESYLSEFANAGNTEEDPSLNYFGEVIGMSRIVHVCEGQC
ncbi:hypothetical protein [Sporomusa malonica]|uniref:hypothetical protein n=1 Tax=Sporomusa malonica TaxID=112901 RepID=UPI000A036FF3